MPGPATDAGKIPFCDAKEEIRAGLESSEGGGGPERPGARGQRQNIVWRNVVLMSLLHLGAVYSLVLIPKAKPLTLLWGKSRRRPLRPGLSGQAALGRARSPLAPRLRCFCSGIFNFRAPLPRRGLRKEARLPASLWRAEGTRSPAAPQLAQRRAKGEAGHRLNRFSFFGSFSVSKPSPWRERSDPSTKLRLWLCRAFSKPCYHLASAGLFLTCGSPGTRLPYTPTPASREGSPGTDHYSPSPRLQGLRAHPARPQSLIFEPLRSRPGRNNWFWPPLLKRQ
ncbi:PREDICTED: stearoyl-CoA desaturase 5 [Mandrillus leucophaeus]|uniref:stearoyl-CoA desaturase 5 n=1 Tax=Mandrillus leucophaeus TaxID=9568 RepID=UPI0005F4D15C|nr:PREDICTED: stearoyl-CoA desaturase 5 [Mandrillus leucophaeus]